LKIKLKNWRTKMALDFPSNPTDGQIYDNYYYDESIGAWNSFASTNNIIPSTLKNATFSTDLSTNVPLAVNGIFGQSANLQDWKVDGTEKASIDYSGNLNANGITLNNDLPVTEGGTGSSTLTGYVFGNGTSAMTASAGYLYRETLYYPGSGSTSTFFTFTKATYPWLRAMRVRVQGGGGAGGGAQTASTGNASAGSGGGAGAYAESFITNIAALSSSISVTAGRGGGGVVANNGESGGNSSFGSLVSANGGAGGLMMVSSTTFPRIEAGGVASAGGVGDIIIAGTQGGHAFCGAAGGVRSGNGGHGGNAVLGSGGQGPRAGGNGSSPGAGGADANGFGGGGGGSYCFPTQTQRAGGNGGPGIVIVELYS